MHLRSRKDHQVRLRSQDSKRSLVKVCMFHTLTNYTQNTQLHLLQCSVHKRPQHSCHIHAHTQYSNDNRSSGKAVSIGHNIRSSRSKYQGTLFGKTSMQPSHPGFKSTCGYRCSSWDLLLLSCIS